MSITAKIWNLSNLKNIISLVTSNLSRKLQSGGTTFQRLYSKRFTYCNKCITCPKKNCDKKRIKPRKRSKQVETTAETKPKRSKSAKASGKCIPFQNKEKKSPISEPPKKKPKKCKPGMKNPCAEKECQPQCSLTEGKRPVSSNDCDRGPWSVQDCPKGDWQREK